MPLKLRAMPDRLLLRFPPPVEKIGSIIVPGRSSMRPELGELVDIGAPLSDETRILRDEIVSRANAGEKFLVPMASGTHLWRKELGSIDAEFEELKDVRSYRITEIATSVDGVD